MRGLRPPRDRDPNASTTIDLATNPYFTRTHSDYFDKWKGIRQFMYTELKSRPERVVITGLEFYAVMQHCLLGPLEERKMVRDFEDFLSKSFFDSQPVTLIPRMGDDVLHIKIGDSDEQPIHNLGDGLQHLMIQAFPLFLYRNTDVNLRLFIEEPELYMHPGYQRRLIDLFLADEQRKLQVFVATHAHQFMDITIDSNRCSVYKITKVPDNRNEGGRVIKEKFKAIYSHSRDFELLSLLGVRNSSVLLSNCTIWVEGITDRLYLRNYLKIVQKQQKEEGGREYSEDIHYSFVEYGGSNVTHWSFLDSDGPDVQRICGPLMLIADKDGESKLQRKEKLHEALGGERFYCLPCKEVENLILPKVLKDVLHKGYGEAEDNLKAVDAWADYTEEPLGTFIENNILIDKKKSPRKVKTKGPYAEDSGTIKEKVDFCYLVLEHTTEYEDLSEEAKKLASAILGFIGSRNS